MLKSISEIIDNSILIKLSYKSNFFIKKYINQLNLQQKFTILDRLITCCLKVFLKYCVSFVMGYVLYEIIYGNKNTNELIQQLVCSSGCCKNDTFVWTIKYKCFYINI